MKMADSDADVIVIGAGVAGLCAALSANELGKKVIVLESAPVDQRGGNTAFAAGAFRFSYSGVDDVLMLIPDLSSEEIKNTEFGTYTDEYIDDINRVTEGRADPALADILVGQSLETAAWLRENGVRFIPNYGSQGYKDGAKTKFRDESVVKISGGGMGMVDALFAALKRQGIAVNYQTQGVRLIRGAGGIEGVQVHSPDGERELTAPAMVIAAGGFESNPEMRARYLGPGWDLAKVRGTRFNVGDGLRMALEIGASSTGNWSGCHSVAWDLSAPEYGDINVGVNFKKDSYPYGIVINADGHRFLDEGADIRTFTYAKYGAVILRQPKQFAWQVFDGKVLDLLRDEYHIRQVTRVHADTIEALACELHGVDPQSFLATVKNFNAAVCRDVPFDPNVKDGRDTDGLAVPKSNWANTIDTPPFEAYAVTCGVTFTFGGLRITPDAEVVDSGGRPIPGLFACGSSVGGLFYFNYPGGSGLTAGAVFGRIAGARAATRSPSDT